MMGFRLKQDILRAEEQNTERGLGEVGPGHGGGAWTWGRGRGGAGPTTGGGAETRGGEDHWGRGCSALNEEDDV